MKKLKIVNKYILICLWILVLGSIFGFFAEMLYALVYTRSIEIRRGLIYGPFIQVYGMGALAFYFLVKSEQDPKKLFFKGMIMGGVLEYLCSFFQEIFFGSVSWDYSGLLLNLNGRTSLQYCIYWGIIAVFFLKTVYPLLLKMEKYVDNKKIIIVSYLLLVFVVFDVWISCVATARQNARAEGIPPASKFDEFLDKTYPDEFLDKIYNNRKNIE